MGLRNKFLDWKEAIESKDFKANLWKTNVMVSSGITQYALSKGNGQQRHHTVCPV